MRELPNRPNVDQLRHQARELLRSASAGDEGVIRRIHEVSDQLNLAGAQLALAREYGFLSWRQLMSEAERRRGRMEGFFDEFRHIPKPPPPEPVPVPWEGPPPGVLGGWVPWRIVLFKSEVAHVVLRNFEAQPSGLSFDLVAQVRQRALAGELQRGGYGAPELGVVFADGRSAASIDRQPATGDPAHPESVALGGWESGGSAVATVLALAPSAFWTVAVGDGVARARPRRGVCRSRRVRAAACGCRGRTALVVAHCQGADSCQTRGVS